MSYGCAPPKFIQRPTLDNLREPLVPIGIRPTSSSSSTTTTTTTNYSKDIGTAQTKTIASSPSTPNPSYVSRSRRASSQQPPPTISRNSNVPPVQQQQRPRDQRSSSRTSLTYTNTPQSQHRTNTPQPRSSTTDIFGYTPSSRSNYSTGSREQTPSLYSDCQSSPLLDNTAANALRPSSANDSNNGVKGKPPGKSKSRLHLNLGLLGKSKQQQPAEPARLRDVTEIRIANPTFTRENLVQNNFDAFFESGEPVYSLEHRTPLQSPAQSIDMDQMNHVESTTGHISRPSSLNFFHKTPKHTVTFRSRSTDIDDAVRVPQKGDRCHSQLYFCIRFIFTFFWFSYLFLPLFYYRLTIC